MLDIVLKKFNYPDSLIKEYEHWFWLLREKQVTLGSSIIISKNGETKFSELSKDSFLELKQVVLDVENRLTEFVQYDKINYLMLMMNDPVVHYHVIPRHKEIRSLGGFEFKDSGFPNVPNLNNFVELEGDMLKKIVIELKE